MVRPLFMCWVPKCERKQPGESIQGAFSTTGKKTTMSSYILENNKMHLIYTDFSGKEITLGTVNTGIWGSNFSLPTSKACETQFFLWVSAQKTFRRVIVYYHLFVVLCLRNRYILLICRQINSAELGQSTMEVKISNQLLTLSHIEF
jgi:hypothetical protein